MKIFLLILVIFTQTVKLSIKHETLTLNKPNLNSVESYTLQTHYIFKYKDSNFGKKDAQNSVDYFGINFLNFVDPVVNPDAGTLKILAQGPNNKQVVYFDSEKLTEFKGNQIFGETWLNFNENFMAVPLSHKFSSYEFQIVLEPMRFTDLDINQLQEQIEGKTPKAQGGT